jgi:tetratricopeptide (TPR) repeat protein
MKSKSIQKDQKLKLFTIQGKIFKIEKKSISLEHIIKKCKQESNIDDLKKLILNNLIFDGKVWNLIYSDSLYHFIDNIKSYYLSNLQEKYLSLKQLIEFFTSDLKNIELISLNKLGIVIVDDILYVVKRNLDIPDLDENEIVLDKSTSFVGVEILGRNNLGDLVFLDSEDNFKPILSIPKENLEESKSNDNKDFITKINNRLETATSIIKSIAEKNLDTIQNRRIYVESCLQKIDRNMAMNNAKKILILEDALTISNGTRYYEIVLEKLIANYMLFIKELLSLGEISQFTRFIDKIINKFGGLAMEPIVETVIEFSDAIKDSRVAIDFLIKAYKLSSESQIELIRKKMVDRIKTYHSYLIKVFDLPNMINLQTRISEYLTNSDKITVLLDLGNLILSSSKIIEPKNYTALLETFLEISRSVEKLASKSKLKEINKIKESFNEKLFDSYVENAKKSIELVLIDRENYTRLDELIHIAYLNCGNNTKFQQIISKHLLEAFKTHFANMEIPSESKIKFGNYAISISIEPFKQKIVELTNKENFYHLNYEQAEQAYQNKKYNVSIEHMRNATMIKPLFFKNWYYIGLNYYMLDDYKSAENALVLANDYSNYKDIDSLYYLGVVYKYLQNYEQSNSIIKILLKIDNRHLEGNFLFIKNLYQLEKFKQMFKQFHNIFKLVYNNYRHKLQKIWGYYKSIVKQLAENIESYPKIETDFYKSLHDISSVLIQNNEFDRIFYIYQVLKDLDVKIEGKLFEYITKNLFSGATNNFKDEKFNDAVEKFKELLELDPKNVDALSRIGNCYMILKNYDLAIEAFSKAVELEPNRLEIKNNLASIYYINSNYTEALNILNKTIKENPDYAIAYYNLAIMYNSLEKYKLAFNNYIESQILHYYEMKDSDFLDKLLNNCISNNLIDEDILNNLRKFIEFSQDYGYDNKLDKIKNMIKNSQLENKIKDKIIELF